MSRISKGKLKHLWALYDVWNIISFRNTTFWFFEPSPEFKATVNKWLIQMEDPKVVDRVARFRKAMDEQLASPYLDYRADKGYYDGCRKLDTEFDVETFISLETLDNPIHLTIVRDKPKLEGVPGKIIAYDIEADFYRVPCGGFNHGHNASGRVYTDGSFTRLVDVDIADTYPKTIEGIEGNLDRDCL